MAQRAQSAGVRIGPEARIVVLHGKDAFLRSVHLDQLRQALIDAGHEPDVIRFDGRTAAIADVLDECRSFGLMQQHKIVVVDGAEEALKDSDDAPRTKGATLRPRDLVQRYAEAPSDSATLVLRAERWNRGKLDKAINSVGIIVKCDAPNSAQAQAWAIARARKRYQRELDRDAAGALVEKLGCDLGRIDTEIAKLSTAAGENESITLTAVHEMVGFTREETVWQIQNLILSADTETVLAKLRDLLIVSRVPDVLVRFAMIDLARKLHGVAAGFASGEPMASLDANLKLWNVKDRVVSIARRADPEQLARLLGDTIEADRAAKTSSVDPGRSLERLAVRFASAIR